MPHERELKLELSRPLTRLEQQTREKWDKVKANRDRQKAAAQARSGVQVIYRFK
jgi:hypothetical protein